MLDQTPSALSRRTLLRSSAFTGLGALLLAACGDGGGATATPTAPDDGIGDEPIDMEQEIIDSIRAAGFGDLAPDWTVIVANFEVLVGTGRIQMGLLDETQTPTVDREVELALVRSGDLEVVDRISDPLFYNEGLGPRGVYVFDVTVPAEGVYYLVASSDGHVGAAPIQVLDPSKSSVPAFGEEFPSVATPTVADDQGLAQLCTLEPDCSMHEMSLDEALAAGRPVVLTIATPLYCQTAVCGPVVEVVEEVKTAGVGPQDAVYIHAEVFSDAGNTPTSVITELGLRSEPWTFLISSDGTLADRFDGPVVPSLLTAAVEALS